VAVSFIFYKTPAEYPLNKVIQYSFNIQNTGSSVLKDVDFSVYAPVELTSVQKVALLNASHSYELRQDEWKNQIMHFVFEEFAPYETKLVRIRAELSLSDVPNVMGHADTGRFLAPEKYVESDDPVIQKQAALLKGDNAAETAKKTFDWVSQAINYQGYIEEDRGALYAIKNRLGDCTEYMYLLNALLRANNIPARSIGGYVSPQDATLSARDYHNWSEVYLDKRWRIIDPQNKKYLEDQSSYIAMRVIADSSVQLLNNSHRFAYTNSGIKVTMN
jgi:transglutaminase-like putative cysteine protease